MENIETVLQKRNFLSALIRKVSHIVTIYLITTRLVTLKDGITDKIISHSVFHE